MSLKQQTVSGVKWTSISMVVTTVIQSVTIIVLARLLSPSDFGLMAMMTVILGFAGTFVDMGISNAIIYRQDTTKEQLSTLYFLSIISGILIFLVICASTPLVSMFYQEPRLSKLLYITAISFIITPLGQQFQILLQKELSFNTLAKIDILSSVTNMLVSIGSAMAGFGVHSLIFGQLASAASRVIALCSIGFKKWCPSFHFAKKDLKGYLSFGIYQMGEKTINYLNINIDNIIIGSLLGSQSLGYYSMAHNIILKPSYLINPVVTKVAFPVFSIIQKETERLKRGYLMVLKLLSTINFPLMVGLAVTAPVAVPVILGNKWTHSIILLQILSVVGLLRSIGNPVGSLLLAKGRADLGFKWNLGLTFIQIPGIYMGAKLCGTTGVAFAYAILQAIFSVFNYIILVRPLLGPCLREYIFSMWTPFWISFVMGITISLFSFSIKGSPQVYLLAIQIFCGVAIYSILYYLNQKTLLIEIKNMIYKKENF